MTSLRAQFSLEYEGPCLWAAIELARGHNIYNAERLLAPPWEVTIYSPLYFLVCAPFQSESAYNYASLRIASMISFISEIYFFYKLVSLYNTDRLARWAGVVTLASYISIWSWSYKARVDTMACALSVMALYFFAKYAEQPVKMEMGTFAQNVIVSLKKYWLSVLCLVAAVYTKQPSLVVLFAVCAFLLCKRRFTDLLVYSLLTVSLCGGIFVGINAITDGGFAAHMTFASKMPFSISDLEKHLNWLGVDWPKLWAAVILGAIFLFKSDQKEKLLLPVLVALISGVLTIYTIGTMYANLNHGFIFAVALTWLTIIFLEQYPLFGGWMMIVLSMLSTYIVSTQLPKVLFPITDRMAKTETELKSHNFSGTTMFVEDPVLAITCGARPLFIDVATFLQVWDRDKRSLSDLETAIAEKRYSCVIINQNDSLSDKPYYFWNDSILEKINEHYKKSDYVVGNGELQQLYVPK